MVKIIPNLHNLDKGADNSELDWQFRSPQANGHIQADDDDRSMTMTTVQHLSFNDSEPIRITR
jgi:hypothetical protein